MALISRKCSNYFLWYFTNVAKGGLSWEVTQKVKKKKLIKFNDYHHATINTPWNLLTANIDAVSTVWEFPILMVLQPWYLCYGHSHTWENGLILEPGPGYNVLKWTAASNICAVHLNDLMQKRQNSIANKLIQVSLAPSHESALYK